MKKRLFALLCVLLLAVCAAGACAEESYSVFIDDGADLLTSAEEVLLALDMRPLTEYGDAVFLSTTASGTADVLAERYFDTHLSAQRSHSGVIFLVDMHTREILIFTRGLLEKRVGRAGAYAITDNVYRYASKGEYYECARSAFAQILALAEGQRLFSPMRVICNLLLAVSAGLIAAYLLVRRSSIHRAPSVASDLMSAKTVVHMTLSNRRLLKSTKRRRESSHSGGSRGGFSGGGFGGGGGGFSGGGSSGSHKF